MLELALALVLIIAQQFFFLQSYSIGEDKVEHSLNKETNYYTNKYKDGSQITTILFFITNTQN